MQTNPFHSYFKLASRQPSSSKFSKIHGYFSSTSQSKVGSPSAANNPFLSSPPSSSGNIVDLFGAADQGATAQQQTNALDDLLQLGNPFADMFGAAPAQQAAPPAAGNQWMSNGKSAAVFHVFSLSLMF